MQRKRNINGDGRKESQLPRLQFSKEVGKESDYLHAMQEDEETIRWLEKIKEVALLV